MGLKQFIIASFTFLCMGLFISSGNAQDTYDKKHIEVSLRMIGHQVLLGAGDSTSQILPIVQSKDRYRIQFESEFALNPDDLVTTINRVVAETKMATYYIVEVEKCETGEIVYSYEMSDPNIIPCKTRVESQPTKSCYSLVFTLPKEKETTLAVQTATSGISAGSYAEANQIKYLLIVIPFLLIGGVFFFLWKKKQKPAIDPNLIRLGEYHFDKKNTALLIEDQKIELTSKEADLLLLLYNAVNTTVEREVILNTVWGDKRDYIGRTLDVSISKLRKKLEADASVKIENTRGVGYKLVMEGAGV